MQQRQMSWLLVLIMSTIREISKKHSKSSLNKLTKVQLEELAKSEFGLELDRRKKKDLLVTEIINAPMTYIVNENV